MMNQCNSFARVRFTFALLLALMLVFAVGSCKKESNKDCGCGSTVVSSVSDKKGVLYGTSLGGITTWRISVSQPGETIPYYTGIICNTSLLDAFVAKEGLQDEMSAEGSVMVPIVFSGDLFNRCITDNPNIIDFAANYSFDVRLDELSRDPDADS